MFIMALIIGLLVFLLEKPDRDRDSVLVRVRGFYQQAALTQSQPQLPGQRQLRDELPRSCSCSTEDKK